MILVSKNWLIILFVFVSFNVYITHYVSENEKSFSYKEPAKLLLFFEICKFFAKNGLVFRV